jgi:hypothetical protein
MPKNSPSVAQVNGIELGYEVVGEERPVPFLAAA